MTGQRQGTRLTAAVACALLLATACGGGDAQEVSAVADATPSELTTASAVPLPDGEPLTATVRDLRDGEEAAYERFLAETEPLPPDGGDLVRCADVPEPEAQVEGTLGGRQNIDDDVMGVVVSYWMGHLDTFGGMWVDRAHGGALVVTFTDDPGAHREAILARAPSSNDAVADDRPLGERDDVAIDVQQVQFTEAQLRATQREIGQYMGPEFGLLGSGGGGRRNRITLDFVDPPEGAVEAFAALVPTAAVCITVTLTPERPDEPLEVIPDLATEDPLVTCHGTGPVPYSTLVAPTPIDDVAHAAVDALRAEFVTPSAEPLPEGDWVVIRIDDDTAVFGALSDEGFGTASFELRGDRWILSGLSAGRPCAPVAVLPDGLGHVEVRLDPNHPPQPADSRVELLVNEIACASGREMGDALLGPQVVETADAVLVAFAVMPVVGDASCQGNPSTPVTITLSEPLGDRVLLDGLQVPPTALTDEPS